MKIIIAFLVILLVFVGCFKVDIIDLTTDKNQISNIIDNKSTKNIPADFSAISNNSNATNENETISDKSLELLTELKYTNIGYSTYGYGLLTSELKDVYDAFKNAIFSLNTTFEVKKTSIEDITSVIMAIERDFPLLFWLDNEYQYKDSDDNLSLIIKLNYNYTREEIESKLLQINKAANDILINIPKNLDDYGKAKIIYDTIISNVVYDLEAVNQREVFGGLIDKKATCIGYAKTFQYLMERLLVQTLMVYGNAGEPHAWNIVLIDGEYYNVDPTWGKKNIINHGFYKTNEFFLVNDNQLSITHGKVDERNYTIPDCNSTSNNFFVKNDLVIDSLDPVSINKVINKALNMSLSSSKNVVEFAFTSSSLAKKANEMNKKERVMDKEILSILNSNYANKNIMGLQYSDGSNVIGYIIN